MAGPGRRARDGRPRQARVASGIAAGRADRGRRTEDAVTAGAKAVPGVDHASRPSLTLDARQLGDLELILSGAFAPLRGFMTSAAAASVPEPAAPADGTPWPVPGPLAAPP